MDDDTIIISSDNLNTDIILTQYIDKGFNKGRINYGWYKQFKFTNAKN